jgi:hypothetical protein
MQLEVLQPLFGRAAGHGLALRVAKLQACVDELVDALVGASERSLGVGFVVGIDFAGDPSVALSFQFFLSSFGSSIPRDHH